MIFKYQYLATAQRLRKDDVGMKLVELYNAQDQRGSAGAVRATPSAFITFPDLTLSDLQNGVQEGVIQMTVIVITTNMYSGDKRMDKGTGSQDHFTQCLKVHKALDGYQPFLSEITGFGDTPEDQDWRVFGGLSRTGARMVPTGKGLLRTDMDYTCRVVAPEAAESLQQMIDTSLEITGMEMT